MKTTQTDSGSTGVRAPIRIEALATKYKKIRNHELPTLLQQLTADPRLWEVPRHIQAMDMRPGGVVKFVEELLAEFRERIGTPTLIAAGRKSLTFEQKRQIYFEIPPLSRPYIRFKHDFSYLKLELLAASERAQYQRENAEIFREQLTKIDAVDFYTICRRAALSQLPDYLTALCIDPKTDFDWFGDDELCDDPFDRYPLLPPGDLNTAKLAPGWWFFQDLMGAIIQMIDRQAIQVQKRLAMTEVTQIVFEAFDYALEEKRMVRIIGNSRFGKTESMRTKCDMRPGMIRYVRTPRDNSMTSLYQAVAGPLGMDFGYGSSRLKERVDFVLANLGIGLAFDEGHYMVPQNYTKTTPPQRLNWIRDIKDHGLPVIIASTPQSFDTSLKRFVAKTHYTMEQFSGRTDINYELPDMLSENDLLAVARIHFPDLGENALGYIANEARLSENYLQAVEAIAHYARFLSRRSGGRATIKILEAAVARVLHREPPPAPLADSLEPVQEQARDRRVNQPLTGIEKHLQPAVAVSLDTDFSTRSLRGAGLERTQTEPVLAES